MRSIITMHITYAATLARCVLACSINRLARTVDSAHVQPAMPFLIALAAACIPALPDRHNKCNTRLTGPCTAHAFTGNWGYWAVTFFQQFASIGNNISIQIAAGLSLKAVYLAYNPEGSVTLQQWIIIFGCVQLLLSQFPDIHSLRLVSVVSTVATIAFTGTAVGLSIYNGERHAPLCFGRRGACKSASHQPRTSPHPQSPYIQ